MLVGPVADLFHQTAGFRTVLADIRTIAGQRVQHLRRHAPQPVRRRLHGAADVALAAGDDLDKRLAVEAQRHCPAQIGIVKGWLVAVDDQVAIDVRGKHLANRVRRLVLDILQLRDGDPEIDIGLAGDKRQQPGRYIFDDRVFDAVEVGTPLLPIIRVAGHRDRLVWLELDKFERAGADRMTAHVARADVTRVDRRPAGRQQGEKRRLWPLQMKNGLEIAIRRHFGDIHIP